MQWKATWVLGRPYVLSAAWDDWELQNQALDFGDVVQHRIVLVSLNFPGFE